MIIGILFIINDMVFYNFFFFFIFFLRQKLYCDILTFQCIFIQIISIINFLVDVCLYNTRPFAYFLTVYIWIQTA